MRHRLCEVMARTAPVSARAGVAVCCWTSCSCPTGSRATTHVGVREGGGQVLAPGEDAMHPEARLADAGLDLAGQPARRKEALGVPAAALPGHPLAATPHAAPHGGVGPLVAELVAEPHTRPHGRVALLAPVLAVITGPGCIPSSKSRQFALSISHTSLGACPHP